MTTPSVGRLDNIVRELERLHRDAQDIFDAHVDCLRHRAPGVPFGTLKAREIAQPAGSTINYVEGLRIVRRRILGEVT